MPRSATTQVRPARQPRRAGCSDRHPPALWRGSPKARRRPIAGPPRPPQIDWQECGKSNVILRGSALAGANLVGTDFAYSDLRNSDLTGADLEKATLTRASLAGSNADKAKFPRMEGYRASSRASPTGSANSPAQNCSAPTSPVPNSTAAISRKPSWAVANFTNAAIGGTKFTSANLARARSDRMRPVLRPLDFDRRVSVPDPHRGPRPVGLYRPQAVADRSIVRRRQDQIPAGPEAAGGLALPPPGSPRAARTFRRAPARPFEASPHAFTSVA